MKAQWFGILLISSMAFAAVAKAQTVAGQTASGQASATAAQALEPTKPGPSGGHEKSTVPCPAEDAEARLKSAVKACHDAHPNGGAELQKCLDAAQAAAEEAAAR